MEHHASGSHDCATSNPHTRQHDGANTQVSGLFNPGFSAYGYSRRKMHVILNDAIVFDDGAGIDDAMGSDACAGVDHHPGHDECTFPYVSEARDRGQRMQQGRQARIERLHAPPGIGPHRIVPNGDE